MMDDQTPHIFTLHEPGRAKLATMGINVTPDDERRAGWTPESTPFQFTPAELELIAEMAAGLRRLYDGMPGLMNPDTHDALKHLHVKATSLLFLEAAKDD